VCPPRLIVWLDALGATHLHYCTMHERLKMHCCSCLDYCMHPQMYAAIVLAGYVEWEKWELFLVLFRPAVSIDILCPQTAWTTHQYIDLWGLTVCLYSSAFHFQFYLTHWGPEAYSGANKTACMNDWKLHGCSCLNYWMHAYCLEKYDVICWIS